MLKPGVDLRGLQPQMAVAYTIACAVYAKIGGYDCVITSAADGVHSANSLHTRDGICRALDLMTKHVDRESKILLVHVLQVALGSQFDVVLESVGLENEHAHVEWDVKETPKQEA